MFRNLRFPFGDAIIGSLFHYCKYFQEIFRKQLRAKLKDFNKTYNNTPFRIKVANVK